MAWVLWAFGTLVGEKKNCPFPHLCESDMDEQDFNKLGITYKKALDMFYASRTSERLHDERSRLYLMSDGYIVDEVLMEQQCR